MLIQNAKTMFETERLIERLSLQASLIRYESGHPVKVLDAMAGDWHYVDILYYVTNMLYGCEYLKGVDNGKDCLADALSNISYLYELTSPKHVSFENMAVEDISENFDEYFDIITNFRPNIGSLLLKKELGEADPFFIYEKVADLLKRGGFFYAITYYEEEAKELRNMLEEAGLSVSVERNKYAADYLINPGRWIVTASKPL